MQALASLAKQDDNEQLNENDSRFSAILWHWLAVQPLVQAGVVDGNLFEATRRIHLSTSKGVDEVVDGSGAHGRTARL